MLFPAHTRDGTLEDMAPLRQHLLDTWRGTCLTQATEKKRSSGCSLKVSATLDLFHDFPLDLFHDFPLDLFHDFPYSLLCVLKTRLQCSPVAVRPMAALSGNFSECFPKICFTILHLYHDVSWYACYVDHPVKYYFSPFHSIIIFYLLFLIPFWDYLWG